MHGLLVKRYDAWVSVKKKTLKHPKADEVLRAQFKVSLADYHREHRAIIYLDESGFKSHDYRPYGYAPVGKPCFGTYNWQLKNQSNAIGALYKGLLFALNLFDCSIDSDVFHHWVRYTLLPELPENSVIVMDNATFHKRKDTQALISKAGHTILWLPPYSPDLNPIEKTWAHVKKKRKAWGEDSVDSLFYWFFKTCNNFKVD